MSLRRHTGDAVQAPLLQLLPAYTEDCFKANLWSRRQLEAGVEAGGLWLSAGEELKGLEGRGEAEVNS